MCVAKLIVQEPKGTVDNDFSTNADSRKRGHLRVKNDTVIFYHVKIYPTEGERSKSKRVEKKSTNSCDGTKPQIIWVKNQNIYVPMYVYIL